MQGDASPKLTCNPPLRPLQEQKEIQAEILRPLYDSRSDLRAPSEHNGEGGIFLPELADGNGKRERLASRIFGAGRRFMDERGAQQKGLPHQNINSFGTMGAQM